MPRLVYMNLSVLNTLSERQFVSGMGEIVKHGLIKDKEYYQWIKDNRESIFNRDIDTLTEMVRRSCIIKKNVVENDPTEKGERALLNFGHTLGHAVEKYMDFKLFHGECVFTGCILAAIVSKNKGLISDAVLQDIIDTIGICFDYKEYAVPAGADIGEIIKFTKNDKKVVGDKIKFILLRDIGDAFIDMDVTGQDMRLAFDEYMGMITG